MISLFARQPDGDENYRATKRFIEKFDSIELAIGKAIQMIKNYSKDEELDIHIKHCKNRMVLHKKSDSIYSCIIETQ